MEQAPQGHNTSLTELKECPVLGQELDSVIIVGPFQLRIVSDSVVNVIQFVPISKNSRQLKINHYYFCPFQTSIKIVFTTCNRKALPCSPW